MQNKQKENGRSMIEMLGVLAIIGVLSVGGIAGYSKAMHRYRVNKTIDQITYMAGAIRSFFAPQKNYLGLDFNYNLWKKAKLVPDDMWDGNSLKHPFDGSVDFYLTYKVKDTSCTGICRSQAFMIYLSYLPEAACIDLITQDWSNAGVSMIHTSNYENPNNLTNAWIIPPVSLDHAVKICEVPATDTNGVRVDFNFDNDVTKGDMPTNIANTLNKLNGS